MSYASLVKKLTDSFFDLIYSEKKKYARYLVLLTLAGFVLRLIAALNLDVFADDMLYAAWSGNVISSGILSLPGNPPLFFYLTDLAYKIFGYTTFASRFFPLIAGTLTIPLVFLITKKLLNERVAIFAALLVTFSNFLIRMTFTEQSLLVFFFSFLGIYSGMLYLENRQRKYIVLSAVVFGLAFLTKYNAAFFILAFLVYAYFYLNSKNEKIFESKKIKNLFLFFVIIFLFLSPLIVFNVLLYKDKGLTDLYLSRVIHNEKSQQLYSGLAGQDTSFFDNLFDLSGYHNYKLVYNTDIIMFILALIGLFILYRRKEKNALNLFFITLLIPFVLQTAGSTIQKHFAFMHVLFAIPAGFALCIGIERINKKSLKIALISALCILLLLNLGYIYGTPYSYLHKSPTSQLKSYINENVRSNDLVLFDDRIYTAKTFWYASPNNFLTLSNFPEFYNYNQNLSHQVLTKIYVVECAIDDCGWGWVSKRSEFNQTTEVILSQLINISKLDASLPGDYSEKRYEFFNQVNEQDIYRVYYFSININPELLKLSGNLNSFYFVPYLYKNMNGYVFNYSTYGFSQLANKLALFVIYISMFLSILTFIALIFYLIMHG